MFLSVMWLVLPLFDGNDESVMKRKELMNGALQIYPGRFISFGQGRVDTVSAEVPSGTFSLH